MHPPPQKKPSKTKEKTPPLTVTIVKTKSQQQAPSWPEQHFPNLKNFTHMTAELSSLNPTRPEPSIFLPIYSPLAFLISTYQSSTKPGPLEGDSRPLSSSSLPSSAP